MVHPPVIEGGVKPTDSRSPDYCRRCIQGSRNLTRLYVHRKRAMKNNWYPEEFPEKSRSCVLSEEIQGGRAFEQAKQEARYAMDIEVLLRSYILRVFVVFVREASELVPSGIWSIDRLESE